MDVAEHEHHRERVAFEGDAERVTHGAVRPVAADDIAERGMLDWPSGRRARTLTRLVVLAERSQFEAAFDRDPEPAEMPGQQALGLVLRQPELGVTAGRKDREGRRAPVCP